MCVCVLLLLLLICLAIDLAKHISTSSEGEYGQLFAMMNTNMCPLLCPLTSFFLVPLILNDRVDIEGRGDDGGGLHRRV